MPILHRKHELNDDLAMIDKQASCEVYHVLVYHAFLVPERRRRSVLAAAGVGILFAIDSSYEQNDHSPNKSNTSMDPAQAAKEAGLRYADDQRPGITRRRGQGIPIPRSAKAGRFGMQRRWHGSRAWPSRRPGPTSGSRPRPWATSRRPAATTRDASNIATTPAGATVRDETKYDRMIDLRPVLPRIREQTDRDLALPGLPRRKVLAAVVRLLEVSLIRVGNDEYAAAITRSA